MDLNVVSETALITLLARDRESEKPSPVIQDSMGQEILARLKPLAISETQKRVFDRKLPSTLVSYLSLRARRYDLYTGTFINENPGALVVSLGCGFDTRYWRVSQKAWNYIEIDLPEVIEAKKEVMGNKIEYKMLRYSVLDHEWIEKILSMQKENV